MLLRKKSSWIVSIQKDCSETKNWTSSWVCETSHFLFQSIQTFFLTRISILNSVDNPLVFPCPKVNFTNVLRAAFAPTVLRQLSKNLKCKHKKAAHATYIRKSWRRTLVKSTPAFNWNKDVIVIHLSQFFFIYIKSKGSLQHL